MVKRIIYVTIGLTLAYHSIYFKKLSEMKSQKDNVFDFDSLAQSLYFKGILKENIAIESSILFSEIKNNPEKAFKTHGNLLGIGNSAFFMVEAKGEILSINNGKILVKTIDNEQIILETKYIFGNAIRDASGLVKLTDFKTNADFNKVSEALNALVRTKILPPKIKNLKIGDNITVKGAMKISRKENLGLVILPVQINDLKTGV